MHPCAAYLEEALKLVGLEEESLNKEDVSQAEIFSTRRFELLDMAWEVREGVDSQRYLAILEDILEVQERLIVKGEELRKKFQGELVVNKKQEGYFSNYRHVKGIQSRSFYCSAKA